MRRFVCALLLTLSSSLASAQTPPPGEPPPLAPQGEPPAEAVPSQPPPPPPEMYAPAPSSPEASPAPAPPSGQWVYTAQYGWLWVPYGRAYTFIPGDPQVFPDQYVYYPIYGWRWVVAPWVYGYGPSPYWGGMGVRRFAWYSRPWFRIGGFWGWGSYHDMGHYRGWIGPTVWGARGWRGAPAYYRSGVAGPRPSPAIRAERKQERREEHRKERREHRR